MQRSDPKFEIETRLRAMLIDKVKKQLPTIEANAKELLKAAIESSPTYQSLRNPDGQLRQELGIERPEVMEVLAQVWVDSLKASVKIDRKSIAITVTAVSEFSDMMKVAFHPFASYVTNDGVEIQWMRWLLFAGSQPVIHNYYAKTANSYEQQFSRTDSLIMRAKQGATYAVPPEHAGTVENNFITKVCHRIGDDILRAIRRNL